MSTVTKKYPCKHCGKIFSYAETSFSLKAEKGESRPEYCPECRQLHGQERQKAKVGYFKLEKQSLPHPRFNSPQSGYSLHGERTLKDYSQKSNWSGKKFGITDEDILAFYEKLEHNQVVIIVAPTGCGKSTFIPFRLLVPPAGYKGDLIERLQRQGQMVITEPLTSAVERIPKYIGEELLDSPIGPGHIFGLRHGSQSGGQEGEQYDRWNLATIVTDGSLRNWIRDGKLSQYSLIMVDEAHQRSCNIETILMLLKNELPRYPNLKVVISSATVNAKYFQNNFREIGVKADILDLNHPSKKKFNYYVHFWQEKQPVKDCHCWLCQDAKKRNLFWEKGKDLIEESDLPKIIAQLVGQILQNTSKGSILIFLHGETVIEDTAKKIREAKRIIDPRHKIPVIPVYRRLGEIEVNKRFNLKDERRILVTTNIAETSHTLDDIIYVIDSGFIKEAEWDPDTYISTLPSRRHSQHGCQQRWGRVGRVGDGYIYCLYTREEFAQFEIDTTPAVVKSCLDEVMLTLNASGITNPQMIPWLVSHQDLQTDEKKQKWQKETQRVAKVIRDDQFVEADGLITDKAMEIFHIPCSAQNLKLLTLADEYNCHLETIIAIFLMATRDGEPRTGANLYTPGLGLLCWDPEWDAQTKMRVNALHQGLKIACQDDLNFVIKLAYCFLKAREIDISENWADYYQLNYLVFQEVLENVKKILESHYRTTAQEEERNIQIGSLERVRSVFFFGQPERMIKIKKNRLYTYLKGMDKSGVISPYCAGHWREEAKVIAATAVEQETIFEDYPSRVPIASFLIRPPQPSLKEKGINFFLDQKYPIGGWLGVKKTERNTYLIKLLETPSPFEIKYRKNIWSEDQIKERQIILFESRFINSEFKDSPFVLSFIGTKSERMQIVRWTRLKEKLIMVLSQLNDPVLIPVKKKVKTLEVKILKVVRDPIGKSGYLAVQTKNGLELPMEFSEMSLSFQGYGLEWLEGQKLILTINNFNEHGLPQLSNLYNIMVDLWHLHLQILGSEQTTKVKQQNFIELPGFIAEINKEEKKAVVTVPREKGIVHSFEVRQNYVPGGELRNLRIGEGVTVRLFDQIGRCKIPLNWLTDEEIKNLPADWEIEDAKVLTPFCLEDKDFGGWRARPELTNFIKRTSWQFCLNAGITTTESLKKKLSQCQPGDLVIGTIKKIMYEDDGETIKSIQVTLANGALGFSLGSDLDDVAELFLTEDGTLPFYIKWVDPETGQLRLVDANKENKRKSKHTIWVQQQKEYILEWRGKITKAQETIRKIKMNIHDLEEKRTTTRSEEWKERFKKWIDEGRQKILEIEHSIQDWEEKIASAQSKLNENNN